MAAVLSFLLILIFSIIVTKVATVALSHTGLSRQSARFQARSAFTGVGFTTTEAENVVSHPVRRRILMVLMLLGNAGMVTVITSLILSFVKTGAWDIPWYWRLLVILCGAVTLWYVATSKWFDDKISRIINWAFKRWAHLDTRDYVDLLHLTGDYQVNELKIQEEDWLAGRSLQELALTDEGVLILGIQRPDGRFLGAPTKETEIKPKDVVIIYGRQETIQELDERRRGWEGEIAHREAISRQKDVVKQQEEEEELSAEEEERERQRQIEEEKKHREEEEEKLRKKKDKQAPKSEAAAEEEITQDTAADQPRKDRRKDDGEN